MEIVLMVMVLALVVASLLWGADSRDGRDWQPRADWQPREEMTSARARAGMR
ncbi:MAG TPA: hypothetical protein VGL20_01130 [Candidatus Dormibacteraeota bacterium]|jgi:hypothetical protein